MDESSERQRVRHQQIADAAIAVFAEKGFHQARVSDIASRAGVADGTIYLYFRNKEDILLSIFEEKMDELIAGLRTALEGIDDPVERIRTFAVFHFGQVDRNQALAEVLQVELRLSNKFLKEYRPKKLWDYLGILEDIIRDGAATGAFRADVEPFLATWAIFGALDELGMQWVLSRKARRFTVDQTARAVADTFLHGIVRVPSPASQEVS